MVAVDSTNFLTAFGALRIMAPELPANERNVIGGSYVEPKAAAQDRLPRCQT